MKLLKEISEGSLGLSNEYEQLGQPYKLRKSARGIVLNENGEMAVQYLRTHDYHKLPGGGVDAGETVEAALAREIQEEVGCTCEIIRPLGIAIEYRNEHNLLHISYGFAAHLLGEVGTPKLEPGEVEEGQETLWLTPATALEQMKNDRPDQRKGHFILEREKAFLEEFLQTESS